MIAPPDDHVIAIGIHGGRRLVLVVGSIDVGAKFAAYTHAAGIVELCEDICTGAAHLVVLPGDDKSACAVHGDGGLVLVVGGGGVYEEFDANSCSGRIESLPINALAAAILIVTHPDNDEVAGGIHGNRG